MHIYDLRQNIQNIPFKKVCELHKHTDNYMKLVRKTKWTKWEVQRGYRNPKKILELKSTMTEEFNGELKKYTDHSEESLIWNIGHLKLSSQRNKRKKQYNKEWRKPMILKGHNQKKQYLYYGNSRGEQEQNRKYI